MKFPGVYKYKWGTPGEIIRLWHFVVSESYDIEPSQEDVARDDYPMKAVIETLNITADAPVIWADEVDHRTIVLYLLMRGMLYAVVTVYTYQNWSPQKSKRRSRTAAD